jgi:hypothetical protein
MSIRVSCPTAGCDLVLEVPHRHAGTTLRCPACAAEITIPADGAAAPADDLPPLPPEPLDLEPVAVANDTPAACEPRPVGGSDFLLGKDEPDLLPIEEPQRRPWDEAPAADAPAAPGDALVVLSLDEPQPEAPTPNPADTPPPLSLGLEEQPVALPDQTLPAPVPEAPTTPAAVALEAYAAKPLPVPATADGGTAPDGEGYSLLDALGHKPAAADTPVPLDAPLPVPSGSPWDEALDRGPLGRTAPGTERTTRPRRKARAAETWRTVPIGLTAITVGAGLTIVCTLLLFLVGPAVDAERGIAGPFLKAAVIVLLILGFARWGAFAAGYACCLLVPPRLNTRRLVVAALALTGLSVFFACGDAVVAVVNGPGRFGYGAASVLGVVGRVLTVAEFLVSVFFLRALARGIHEPDLGGSAGRLVTFTVIGIALGAFLLLCLAATSPATSPEVIRVAFGWIVVIVVVTDLAWYTWLAWALRTVIRESLDDG